MSRKNLLAVLSFLFICHFSFAQEFINDPNAEARTVSAFTNISVSSAIDLHISQSTEDAVAVSAKDSDVVKHITTEVINGTLIIGFDGNNFSNWGSGKQMKAYVSIKTLSRLQASGSSDIFIEGKLTATDLAISLSGSSDFKGEIVAQNLRLEAVGSSDFKITGSCANLHIIVMGSSDVKGYNFVADNCDIQASGASDIKITVNKELTAKASGSSDIYYKGNPTVKQISAEGSADVKQVKS